MADDVEFNRLAIKVANVEDKILDIEKITKILNMWAKENDYELIPMIKMLNNKVKDALKIIESWRCIVTKSYLTFC